MLDFGHSPVVRHAVAMIQNVGAGRLDATGPALEEALPKNLDVTFVFRVYYRNWRLLHRNVT